MHLYIPLIKASTTGSTSRAFRVPGCPDDNPVCDSPANIGRFGNSGVNILQTPAMKNIDLALMKEFRTHRAQHAEVPDHFLERFQPS